MDDVDAVQAQIARNMLTSGDWVTARLDGVAYLEKPPLQYWLTAGADSVFGMKARTARLIPGDRPIGVFTTGQLQQWVHHEALPVGRRALIELPLAPFEALAAVRIAQQGEIGAPRRRRGA